MSTIDRKFKVGAGIEFGDGTSVTTADGLVGATGAQGPQGNTGLTGATGPQGIQGEIGATGSQGVQGNDGATGAQGIQGETGATGAQGDTGATGNGFNNLISTSSVAIGTGAKGFTVTVDAANSAFSVGNIVQLQAVDSPSGAYGMGGYIAAYSGTSLTVGVSSVTGSGTYSSWSISLTGRTGATGPTGATGQTGATGAQGEQGIQGDVGATGPQGIQGIQGDAGPAGATGAQGATGDQGETGLGFNIAKTYASVAALEADTSPSGIVAGEFALINTSDVEDAENSRLYLWNGSSYTYVNDLSGAAGIQGPQGATGAQGIQGIQGETGATGAQGIQGEQGIQGIQGATGPTGATGETGLTGNDGATGAQGETGATGAAGANFALTSSSSVEIGTGSKTFTVSADAAFSGFKVGTLVNAIAVASPGSAYGFGGYVISYSGTTLIISASSTVGSGTYSSWTFVVAGRTGATGPTGATGEAGPVGATGAEGATGPQGPGTDQDAQLSTTGSPTFDAVTANSLTISTATITAGVTSAVINAADVVTHHVWHNEAITSTATQAIMVISPSNFTTIKYMIQLVDDTGAGIDVHSQEMTAVYANGNLYETEYAIVQSNESLGDFNTAYTGGNVELTWTPAPTITSVSIRVYAIAISS